MNATLYPFIFTQTGLDSGALTLLGAIIHQFPEAGEYRGVSTDPSGGTTVFYLTVANDLAVAQVNIDLAALANAPAASAGCSCGTAADGSGGRHFTLQTHGYAVLHVSGGAGGYAVRIGRATNVPEPKLFDSTTLEHGDLFAATLLRPGRYRVRNPAQSGARPGEVNVAYPAVGATAFQPPAPVRIECTASGFREAAVQLTAMQGCIFECRVRSRIVIELVSALDPPS